MQPFESGKQYISYKYLEANSPSKLEIKMLQIQVSAGNSVNFTPPIYNSKTNKYTTWYLFDFSLQIKGEQKLNMESK